MGQSRAGQDGAGQKKDTSGLATMSGLPNFVLFYDNDGISTTRSQMEVGEVSSKSPFP